MKDNYKNNIDLDKIKKSNEVLCNIENCLNTKDYTTYFLDIENFINSINYKHGNCIDKYKEEIELILEELRKVKEDVTKLNNSLSKTILTFQSENNLNTNKNKESNLNPTTNLRLNEVVKTDKFTNANILDIDNQNIERIPTPAPTTTGTNSNSPLGTIASVGAIISTGVASSVGAVYLATKNNDKKKEGIEEINEELDVDYDSGKDEEKEEYIEKERYRADRNPENFNKFFDK